MIQAHVFIGGDVIGVGFRAWTAIQAKTVGVNGWAKNSGTKVEAVFQGEKEKVERLIELVKKGPPASTVDEVEVVYEKSSENLQEFVIRR